MANETAGRRSLSISALLRPHRRILLFALLAAVGEGIANLLEPWPVKIVLDQVIKSKQPHGWLSHLIRSTVGQQPYAILMFAAAFVIVIALFDAVCTYSEQFITTKVAQLLAHDLRRTLYHHIQTLSLKFHDEKQTGDLVSRITSDIDAIQSFVASSLMGVFINCLTLIGMVGVMFYINWRFTLIALSITPVLFGITYTYTRRIKALTREARKSQARVVSVIQEVLSSIRVVKAFAREDYEQRRLEEESLESVEVALRARGLKAKLAPLVGIIVAIGTALVLWFGASMVLKGALSPGSLIVFIMYLGKMYKPMQQLSKMTDDYSKAVVGYDRIQEVLDIHMETRDRPGARPAPPFKGRVEFDRVYFSYSPDAPILKDVSFTIEPGQTAAFIGPTGAGKSTIISLVSRFYDPTQGAVKIDGRDIRDYTQKSVRDQISFVLQETILFHGTVWHNIAYGKPGATRREIIRAAELANAHEFIEKMPRGYDTIVGERGVTLSGGQRQRIAIARAIIRNTPLLILDEPSTGLDAASEILVFEALDRLMQGRTSLVISHNLSITRRAGVIFVVKDGTIVEHGAHDELIKDGGLYAQLYALQTNASEVTS